MPIKALQLASIVIGVTYPFAVFFGLNVFSPLVIVLCLLLFLLLRLAFYHKQPMERFALLLTIVIIGTMLFFDQRLAVQLYPVVFSLSLATVFYYSIRNPPTIIERIARITEPNLNESGVQYTTKVAVLWLLFFLCNAGLSAATIWLGDLRIWTFYNGFLSYVLVAVLMGGELCVRQTVKKNHVNHEGIMKHD